MTIVSIKPRVFFTSLARESAAKSCIAHKIIPTSPFRLKLKRSLTLELPTTSYPVAMSSPLVSRNNQRKKQKQRKSQRKYEGGHSQSPHEQLAAESSTTLTSSHGCAQTSVEADAYPANTQNYSTPATAESTLKPSDSRIPPSPISRGLIAAPCVSCDIIALVYLPASLPMFGKECTFRERLGLAANNIDTLIPTICAQCEQDQLCIFGRLTHRLPTRALHQPPVILNTSILSAWPHTAKLLRTYDLKYDSTEQQKVVVRRADWWHSGLIQKANTNGTWEARGRSDVATGKIEFIQVKRVSKEREAPSPDGLEIIAREKKRCDAFFGFFDSP